MPKKNLTEKQQEAKKRCNLKYAKSEKGKETRKRYLQKKSDKTKEAQKIYAKSEKGKETRKRYAIKNKIKKIMIPFILYLFKIGYKIKKEITIDYSVNNYVILYKLKYEGK